MIDRSLTALLPIVGLLWLSEQFRWFAFNEHKGWTVLIAMAVVCLAVVLLLLWFLVSLVRRRRLQFSIRSLLVLIAVVAVMCSWFTVKMQQARRQRESVERMGGIALYGYQIDADGLFQPGAPAPGFPWLRNLLGVDFLSDVTFFADIHMRSHLAGPMHVSWLRGDRRRWAQVDDGWLENLEGLPGLRVLRLVETKVTDARLVHLKEQTNLEELSFSSPQVTDAGIRGLQEALPNCEINPRRPKPGRASN